MFLKRLMQSLPGCQRQRRRFGVAENLDSLLRSVYNDAAILASSQVLFNRGTQYRI